MPRPSMMQRTLSKTVGVCAILAGITCAMTPPTWVPVRILGLSYPRIAQLARLEGTVQARCWIRIDGSVARVEIVSGPPLLGHSVETNLLRWVFRHGDAVAGTPEWFAMTYEFHIKGTCNDGSCKEEFWFEYPNHVTVVSEAPRVNGIPGS